MKKFTLVVGLILVVLAIPAGLLWRRHSDRQEIERLRAELIDRETVHQSQAWPRPRLPGEPVAGTARAAYGLAIAAMDGTPEGTERAVELFSRGTRTDRVGLTPFPRGSMQRVYKLGDLLAGAGRAAEAAGRHEFAVTRALECIQVGTDLTRGNGGMERYYGVRVALRGAEALARFMPPGVLSDDQRIWIREWLRGPRKGAEVVSPIRLDWLSSYRSLLAGAGNTAWVRQGKGPLTDAGVPDAINPESLSDREISDAWRGLERTLSRIESEVTWGPGAGKQLSRIFTDARVSAGTFEKEAYLHIERRLLLEWGLEETTRTILLELLSRDE